MELRTGPQHLSPLALPVWNAFHLSSVRNENVNVAKPLSTLDYESKEPLRVCALLGIDYGTTGFKVHAFDARGASLASCAGELAVSSPRPGWVEQDISQGWEMLCGAIRTVIVKANLAPAEVVAVSATGTYNLSVFDQAGRVLRPAILYGDTRVPPPADVYRILSEIGPQRLAAVF
jgi:hypothetical protein